MKTKILLVTALVTGITACSQSGNNVPESVKTAFSQKFSNVSRLKWSRENDSEWEAEFTMDGRKYSANFDNSGTWTETEYEISLDKIPDAVKATLEKESEGAKVKESEISITNEGKAYEFEIQTAEGKTEIQIDGAGNLIKKLKQEEEDED